MSITRFFATRAELRERLSGIQAQLNLRYIPVCGSDGYPDSCVPMLSTIVEGVNTAFDSSSKDATGAYYTVRTGTVVQTRRAERTMQIKGRLPWQKERQVQREVVRLSFEFEHKCVLLVADGEGPDGHVYQSIVKLEDPLRGDWRLYLDLASILTYGYERVDEVLVSPGAMAALRADHYLIGGLNPGDDDVSDLEWVESMLEVHRRTMVSAPTSRLSWLDSWVRLGEMGYSKFEGDPPPPPQRAVHPDWLTWDDDVTIEEEWRLNEDEEVEADEYDGLDEKRFEFYRRNVYGADFRYLSVPHSYLAKSTLEAIRFTGSDLTETRMAACDFMRCDFTSTDLSRAYFGAVFCACDF